MQEGEHEAKHEEGGEEVCEDGGGSGNITIGVGEEGHGGTRKGNHALARAKMPAAESIPAPEQE